MSHHRECPRGAFPEHDLLCKCAQLRTWDAGILVGREEGAHIAAGIIALGEWARRCGVERRCTHPARGGEHCNAYVGPEGERCWKSAGKCPEHERGTP